MGGKTEGKRGMEGDEWRGGEAFGDAGAELVADSGESHTLMNGEARSSSGSSLHSCSNLTAGIASSSILWSPFLQLHSHHHLSRAHRPPLRAAPD